MIQRMSHSKPSASRLCFPINAQLLAMKTAVKPESMLIARFLWVALRRMISMLIDIATKISPTRAAEPLPTIRKKLIHWSGRGVLPKNRLGRSTGNVDIGASAAADIETVERETGFEPAPPSWAG